MKIVDIKLTLFNIEAWLGYCPDGHWHPGMKGNRTVALLTIVADNGCEGYHFSEYNHYVPSKKFDLTEKTAYSLHPYNSKEKGSTHAWQLILRVLKPLLIGQDPLEREKIWLMMTRIQRMYTSSLTDNVIAAVDLALWDLAGRYYKEPVYKLLGGYRTKLKAYASTMVGDIYKNGLSTNEDFSNFAKQCKNQGFKAYKLHTWANQDWNDEYSVTHKPAWQRDVEVCAAVREAVGNDMELMIDPYHYYDKEESLELGKGLEKLNFVWLEEPMDEYMISSYQWLCERLDIPVLGPELHRGKHYTRAEWAINKVSDINRAGVLDVGGLTGLVRVIHTCEALGMRLELHYGPATTHAMAIMPYPGEYYEYGMLHPFLDYVTPPFLNQSMEPLDNEGYVNVPDRPGIGWDIKWDYIKENIIAEYS